jgi:putative hydrolase of the HAD superfamily
MMQSIETILFDFGGTLDADGVAWKERFHLHYQAEGLNMTPETFSSAFYVADDALIGRLPPDADLSETVRRLVGNLDCELAGEGIHGIQTTDGDWSRRVTARFLADSVATFARNRPLLDALNARYRLGIVSNFYGNLDAVCRGAELTRFFGVIIDSQRVGVMKPDPGIFQAALDALGSTPETTLFVGDSLRRDREGARRMGMGFVWIAPRDTQDAAVVADENFPDGPAITQLTDLVELLT